MNEDHNPVPERTPCPHCDGKGYTVEPKCCGNCHPNGECRSYCCVPDQVPCNCCGGTGQD